MFKWLIPTVIVLFLQKAMLSQTKKIEIEYSNGARAGVERF